MGKKRSKPRPAESDDGNTDRLTVWVKFETFFRSELNPGQRWVLLGIFAGILGAAFGAGYWLGEKLATGGSDGSPGIRETTATPVAISSSYEEFLAKRNGAQRTGHLPEFLDQSQGKLVRWDCVILETNAANKWYKIGPTQKAEVKDQCLAQFNREDFDAFVDVGERKKVEGKFVSADQEGILLCNCRFTD